MTAGDRVTGAPPVAPRFEANLGDHVPERVIVEAGALRLVFPIPASLREALAGESLVLTLAPVAMGADTPLPPEPAPRTRNARPSP